ncbi:hypothetical protein [Halomonas sp. WWR20]
MPMITQAQVDALRQHLAESTAILDSLAPDVPATNPPTAISLSTTDVDEHRDGAGVADLTVADSDSTEWTFTLSDDRFEMKSFPDGGHDLKLKTGVSLDVATEPTVPLTITAVDPDGNSYTALFTISVTPDAAEPEPTDPTPTLEPSMASYTLSINDFRQADEASGDDWTAAFQAAAQSGKPVRLHAPTRYIISEPIALSDGTQFIGDSNKIDRYLAGGENTQGGVWIIVDESFPTDRPLFGMRNNTAIQGVNVFYRGQDFNTWPVSADEWPNPFVSNRTMYDPKVYAPTFAEADPDEKPRGLVVTDCMLINSYIGVEFMNHERHRLERLNITPIKAGVRIGESTDVSTMDNVLVYPFWSQGHGFSGNSMRVNIRAEYDAIGFEFGATDGEKCGRLSAIGAGTGMMFSRLGGSPCQNVYISVFEQDLSPRGVLFEDGTDIVIDTIVTTALDTRYTSVSSGNPAFRFNSENQDETKGLIYGVKVATGGIINVGNLNVRRSHGHGLIIDEAVFGTHFNQVSIFNQSPGGHGLHVTRPNGIYHASVGKCTVNCNTADTVPFYIYNSQECAFEKLAYTGATPTNPIRQGGLTRTIVETMFA